MVTYDEFKKLEIKTAKVLSVKDHPSADKLYILEIDLGLERRQIVAGIKLHYTPQELIGKNIIVIANLESATIRGVESRGMLLAASDNNTLSLVTLDKNVPPGLSVK